MRIRTTTIPFFGWLPKTSLSPLVVLVYMRVWSNPPSPTRTIGRFVGVSPRVVFFVLSIVKKNATRGLHPCLPAPYQSPMSWLNRRHVQTQHVFAHDNQKRHVFSRGKPNMGVTRPPMRLVANTYGFTSTWRCSFLFKKEKTTLMIRHDWTRALSRHSEPPPLH